MLVSKDELIYSLLHEEEVKSYCKFLVSSLVSRHFKRDNLLNLQISCSEFLKKS